MGVSVNRDAKGWRVGFQLPDGRRGSVRLGGAATKRHHDEVAGRMRSLIAARKNLVGQRVNIDNQIRFRPGQLRNIAL